MGHSRTNIFIADYKQINLGLKIFYSDLSILMYHAMMPRLAYKLIIWSCFYVEQSCFVAFLLLHA